ncbi:MAG: hypothetical protein LH618_19470, partial [Saprospiraceae bacterium]|nr:hypothetical protein [Saprospiraceae bacterium]
RGYFCHNWLIIIAYPDKKPGCRFAPFAFPMKTGMSLRSICNFAYLLMMPTFRYFYAMINRCISVFSSTSRWQK